MRPASIRAACVGCLRLGLCLSVATATYGKAGDIRVEPGIAYATPQDKELLLDVYQPASNDAGNPRPAVLLVHGGGWYQGNRHAPFMVRLAKELARRGIVAFSIDYRLVKPRGDGEGFDNQYPAAIDDCRTALRWIRDHAKQHHVDPTVVGACGVSAGGHLVSLLGTDGSPEGGSQKSGAGRVQAVVNINGPVDLTQDFSAYRLPTVKKTTVQDLVDRFVKTAEAKRNASPQFLIDDRTPPFLLIHGTNDPLVPVEQSQRFHAALEQAGRPSEYIELKGEGHGFSPAAAGKVVARTVDFFVTHLQPAAKRDENPAATTQQKPAANPPNLGALFKMHYDIRVKAFREQNPVFQNVVLVGDSITEGFDVGRYFPGRRVLNRGIGADVIGNALPEDDRRGVLRRLDESIFDCAASDVFLMIGINDLNSGRKPDVMEPGYRELLEKIRKKTPAVRIHVQSLLPTSGKHTGRNADVLDFNERLKRIAAEFDCEYIDLHALMVDDNGELKSEFTADGLHLTPPAYEVWREEILKSMKWR